MMPMIDAQTKLYGIIGYPLGHTFSPAMHNAAFQAAGVNAVYLAFPIRHLLQLKFFMKQFGIRGLSVTIPHKIKVRRLLDVIDPLALQIGSVNTIFWNKDGLLEGHNTDGPGAVKALQEAGFSVKNKKVLIIGSGGSARAVAFSVAREHPQRLGILARNRHMLTHLAKNLRVMKNAPPLELLEFPGEKAALEPLIKPWRWSRKVLSSPADTENYDLIIQTTPVGMSGHPEAQNSPLSADYVFKHQVIFDIVYNPQVTPLLQIAKKKKCSVVYGYKMLLHQGAMQFELFTGLKADLAVMEKALLRVLSHEK